MVYLTVYRWAKMQPATPARPEAKAKVSESTWRVEMPRAAAIGRFCTTARTLQAERRSSKTTGKRPADRSSVTPTMKMR